MEEIPAKRRKLDHSSQNSGVITSTGLSGSAFAMQAGELLKEEKVAYENDLVGVDDLLHKVKASIEGTKSHEFLPVLEAAAKLNKLHHVKVPFPNPKPPSDSNYKVSFERPTVFNVVGSYVSRTMTRSQRDHAVDMIVAMPEAMLQAKDYLDMRYFYKRAYFLAVIANAVQVDLKGIVNTSFEYLCGNPLLPILSLQPEPTHGESQRSQLDYRIRIIPCAPDGFMPTSKLLPGAAMIRKSAHEDKDHSSQPTPFYNSTLKAEACFPSYLRLLRQAEKNCPGFKDACMLGRIWLQQRGLGGAMSQGGFGSFEWAVLLALLLQGRSGKKNASLSTSLTSTQLFKALVQFLSVTSFAEKPYVLGPGNPSQEELVEPGPVLYDSARHLNIAFKMSSWSATILQHHAKQTNSLLSNSAVEQFTPTFITKADAPLQLFDLVARLRCEDGSEEDASRQGRNWGFANKVYSVLERAFGDRARLVYVFVPGLDKWPLSKSAVNKTSTIDVGILFNPANMSRQVDHGPSSEEKEEAKEFRRFWGDKAELRRFADGSILETLIWKSTTPTELCEEITRYSLRLHLNAGLLEGDLTFYGHGFASLVPIKDTDAAAFNAARKAFSSFERHIRDLEDLPLHVRQLAPTCPELRHTSIKAPFGPSKSGPRPMETVLSFEVSGKWPENLAAVQRTKVAFLLKIASLLEQAKPEIRTYVGLGGVESDVQNLAFLDVVYDSGASFRLRIQSDLEEALLERRTKDKTTDERVRAQSATLLAALRRSCTQLPLLTQTVSTFATRFPALSPSIRLLKHWFNAHMLGCHFNEELIELVVLGVFSKNPASAPSSASTGFLQALLFLAHWDWRTEPLVVDTSGEMSPAAHATVSTRLEAWRQIDPNMNRVALIAATTHDYESGTTYTTLGGQARPSRVVATRMTALARSASRLVKERGIELEPKTLFTPSLKDYDVLIHLNSKAAKNALRTYETDDYDGVDVARHSKFKNLDERTGQDPLPLAQHPVVTFLDQLHASYNGTLLLFHGAEDDLVIGGIWNPGMEKRSFKPNLPSCYRPVVGEEGAVELNKDALLAEIARIGGSMVDRIEIKAV
ncbi:Nrap protein [Thozetella sp. PMI_491]|nr:Nrap protein [Thozetella sp. PMI_491]